MQFAETVVPLELAGKKYNLYYNSNTMRAYEEVTGKMFLDTVSTLYDVINAAKTSIMSTVKKSAEGTADEPTFSPFEVIRKIPMKDLQALIWAALHEYGKNPADPDEPTWPMTLSKVGRMIQLQDVPRVFNAFLRGQIKNSPTAVEMGESQAGSEPASNGGGSSQKTSVADGGERTIELPADAFA
jgi:hypothetical protein